MTKVLGTTHGGRPIEVRHFGDRGPRVLLICGIHGDERCTVVFGHRLGERLEDGWAERAGVRVAFLPVANPDGVAADTRENARGVDLNRNFPADNHDEAAEEAGTPLSEPETRVLVDLIDAYAPDAIITVHCCEPMFDWDGPAESLAETMARAMPDGLEFPVDRLGSYPGSLGSWAGAKRGIPVVTVEFDCHDATPAAEQYPAMEAAIDAGFRFLAGQ